MSLRERTAPARGFRDRADELTRETQSGAARP